jgi:hypothetical protein
MRLSEYVKNPSMNILINNILEPIQAESKKRYNKSAPDFNKRTDEVPRARSLVPLRKESVGRKYGFESSRTN